MEKIKEMWRDTCKGTWQKKVLTLKLAERKEKKTMLNTGRARTTKAKAQKNYNHK